LEEESLLEVGDDGGNDEGSDEGVGEEGVSFDITQLQTTGNVLGVNLVFAEPFFKVKLGEKEF